MDNESKVPKFSEANFPQARIKISPGAYKNFACVTCCMYITCALRHSRIAAAENSTDTPATELRKNFSAEEIQIIIL